MVNNVSKTEVQRARRVPLATFLNCVHPGELQQVSKTSYRKANQHALKVNEGIAGYYDWGSGRSGNSIDYLIEYLGYSFVDAVRILCTFADGGVVEGIHMTSDTTKSQPQIRRSGFVMPEPTDGSFRQLYAYLTQTRKIPVEVINRLVHQKLLFQAKNRPRCYNNIVFASIDGDFYEMHGTNSRKKYHRSQGKRGNECWYFTGQGQTYPARIYVTEGAIDAVSLYVLHPEEDSMYSAIGGAGKQKAIDRLKTLPIPIIIATDNDEAGDDCRSRNPDCATIRPKLHDWNDDLRASRS